MLEFHHEYSSFLRPWLNALRQRAVLEAQRLQLYQNIAVIEQQIAQWDAHIAATEPLAEQAPDQLPPGQVSLADLCRMALNAYGDWVTAQQVRSYLIQLGIRFEYSNEMAVLHNTLKRVGQTGRDNFGNTVYAPKD